jgi:hypothetical protein
VGKGEREGARERRKGGGQWNGDGEGMGRDKERETDGLGEGKGKGRGRISPPQCLKHSDAYGAMALGRSNYIATRSTFYGTWVSAQPRLVTGCNVELGALKMQDQKMQDLKMTEQIGFW